MRARTLSRTALILCVILGVYGPSLAGTSYTVPSDACKSINEAMVKAKTGDTVAVKKGVYPGPIFVENGVVLKSIVPFEAVLDGKGRKDVVTLGGSAEVSGFEIRNGTVGVFSKGMNNRIVGCHIFKNWGSGIICIGHLPLIENNVIAYNRGSGIQAYKIRATVFPAIVHNTIAFNSNNGIAVGGTSDIGIHNNIMAHNERFGIKISEGDANVKLVANSIFGNGTIVPEAPAENFDLDPKFMAPRKLDFALGPDSPCRGRGTDGKDLGVVQ